MEKKKFTKLLKFLPILLLVPVIVLAKNKTSKKTQPVQAPKKQTAFIKIRESSELFKNFEQKKSKSVFIFEVNAFHGECLPGAAKYFKDLGYNVDILAVNFNLEAFSCCPEADKIRLFGKDLKTDKEIINFLDKNKEKIKKYDKIYTNSFQTNIQNWIKEPNFLGMIHSLGACQNKKELWENKKLMHLVTLKGKENLYLNTHYFGDFKTPEKQDGKPTRFIVVGTNWKGAAPRDYDLIIKTAETLAKNKQNFKIIIIGSAKIDIPKNIEKHFEKTGRIPYLRLYEEVQKAHFMLLPFHPGDKVSEKFKNQKATGNSQLCYGFKLPAVICKEFADTYKFNTKNSVIYNNLDLKNGMQQAINMKKEQYKSMQNALASTTKEIYNESLKNLKAVLTKMENR